MEPSTFKELIEYIGDAKRVVLDNLFIAYVTIGENSIIFEWKQSQDGDLHEFCWVNHPSEVIEKGKDRFVLRYDDGTPFTLEVFK